MDRDQKINLGALGFLGSVGVAVGAAFTRYRVANPGNLLARTGLLIRGSRGLDVRRSFFLLPFQRMVVVPLQPRQIKLRLSCLSAQYFEFKLPVTYTLSPFVPTDANVVEVSEEDGGTTTETSGEDLFKCYVEKILPLDEEQFVETVEGIIHGETRALTSKMSIDAMNDDREEFKIRVVQQVQKLLYRYGLKIDAANIAEIQETKGYIEARERKKLSDALQQSEIDVAEATKLGDIGKKEREALTRQQKARFEAETQQTELLAQEKIEHAKAQLKVIQAQCAQRALIAEIEAKTEAQKREQILKQEVEDLRKKTEEATQQANTIPKAVVEAQCATLKAENTRTVLLLDINAKAESTERLAKAKRVELEEQAKGDLAIQLANANGTQAMFDAKVKYERDMLEARAKGAREMFESCGGQATEVMSIQAGIPQKQAEENAKAVNGLHPQIWSMSGDDAASQITKIVMGLAPLANAIQRQFTAKQDQ